MKRTKLTDLTPTEKPLGREQLRQVQGGSRVPGTLDPNGPPGTGGVLGWTEHSTAPEAGTTWTEHSAAPETGDTWTEHSTTPEAGDT